ncbi:cell wall-binding repeat-containing protein [Ornithinimicrobium cryptoxanthini]|uniref:cell wall-binding repeat-containing protein n=1 Tax=Ornithinimicrobium cryptoxanthini TaxID=2934161 RepID=UPI002117E89D|nr:cell wall-binding repeat-containing protein [Ornithinimicrobium cryptoxanthini]
MSQTLSTGRGARGRDRLVRRWVASSAGAALVLTGSLAAGVTASATPPTPAEVLAPAADKIQPEVTTELEETGRATVLIRFADRPDMGAFAAVDDWDARGQAVYDALTSTADRSQRGARTKLEAAGIDYTSFFISNAILVRGGNEALLTTLAADPEIEGVYLPADYEVPELAVGEELPAPHAVEWGIANINADDVWAQFGVTGEELVIANIDTGVDYTHPALVNQYRGNNGDGTFDHSYNWFDAAGAGSDEPVDFVGHGTHTMGTMVGSDGGANQIGVAPGARWIAANGCCPSDEALITSGQWLLAPTDLNGENPLPSMRPHIINNSWGSELPSNDPFMEDISQAWAAAGIFGVWSNGNAGPECETSGSPGSRTLNYSVGAYDVGNAITGFSSRGAGQDGETKPNISAPGANVRSAVPGGDYLAADGTSMAAPHVAGTIALLWSAAPDLIGDTELTKELLDGTAVDTADDQCGGTEADNNVYGEGRLDALALLESAPIGPTGNIAGTVTDASTDGPIAGAGVTLVGERTRSTATAADGTYALRLGTGEWDATISKFGYLPQTDTVTIPLDETLVHDVDLTPASSGMLTGTVTDGSGQGWPLYARISVVGVSGVAAYTDPETGDFALSLPVGNHTVQATSQLPGYVSQTRDVVITESGAVSDFALTINPMSCNAPGYDLVLGGVSEAFSDFQLPAGWALEDLNESGNNWEFLDPYGIPNGTGGDGGFAVANSDFTGPGSTWDAALVSPAVDITGDTNTTLTFKTLYETVQNVGDQASVEITTDGGASWDVVWESTSFAIGDVHLDLTDSLAGATEIQTRFRYQGTFDLWWQVDDVFLGERTCVPGGGGLVVGYVQNDVDGAGIIGAKVTSLDQPADSGTTRATPDDENLDDGFYWLYSSLEGTHPFEASARNHGTDQQDVTVPAGAVGRADFVLGQALLEIDPTSIETTVALGAADTGEFTVTNTGTSPAELTFTENRGGFEILRADGTRMTTQQLADAAGTPLIAKDIERSLEASALSAGPTGSAFSPAAAPTDEPWTDLTQLPLQITGNRVVTIDGVWFSVGGFTYENSPGLYRYDAVAMEWMPLAAIPAPVEMPLAAAVDGQIVVAGGWSTTGDPTSDTWIYDPETDSWSSGAPMPTPVSSMGVAVVDGAVFAIGGCTTGFCEPVADNVQAYDLSTDTWSEFSPAPSATAFPACGALEGVVVCAGGVDGAGQDVPDTWAFDPSADSWSPLAPAPVALFAPASAGANGQLIAVGGIQDGQLTNASWAYDPTTDSWSPLPNANHAVYRGGGACGVVRAGGQDDVDLVTSAELLPGFDLCSEGGGDVDWLSLDITEAVLNPGESVTVQVTTDSAAVNQPGTYTAAVGIVANVPIRPTPVDVTMHVTAPLSWGKVEGTAYLAYCDGGQVAGDGITIDIAPVREDVGQGWVISTNSEGYYARWINTQVGTLRMTATLGGYRPDAHLVDLLRGSSVTQDFSLLEASCQENPDPVPPEVIRLAGQDRYATATRISAQFAPGVDTVYVATGVTFPDALAAAARAGSLGGPVLLVRPTSVPAVTSVELARLDPANLVVVGGTTSVSNLVANRLRAVVPDATFTRHAGANRYETAALIAGDLTAADVAYVVTGEDFPDALTAASRAGSIDGPVLLVKQGSVPAATAAQLTRLAPERIVIVGGTTSVSPAVAGILAGYGTVERVAGANRYETAAALTQDWQTSQDVFIATGQDWPDALAGAARAGATVSPVLLVRQATIPPVTWAELERLDPGRIFVLGGETTISPAVEELLRTLE